MIPMESDFEREVRRRWDQAQRSGEESVVLSACEIHLEVGGYPGPDHRMPNCCQVMKRLMAERDRVLKAPPGGQGASLVVRYALPR